MFFFRLEIALPKDARVEDVSRILNLQASGPRSEDGNIWAVEDEEPEIGWIDFIGRYCDSVRRGMTGLEGLGISSDYISIWMLYEYDQQCNMEFTPDEMKVMGELGITFCISCWAK